MFLAGWNWWFPGGSSTLPFAAAIPVPGLPRLIAIVFVLASRSISLAVLPRSDECLPSRAFSQSYRKPEFQNLVVQHAVAKIATIFLSPFFCLSRWFCLRPCLENSTAVLLIRMRPQVRPDVNSSELHVKTEKERQKNSSVLLPGLR